MFSLLKETENESSIQSQNPKYFIQSIPKCTNTLQNIWNTMSMDSFVTLNNVKSAKMLKVTNAQVNVKMDYNWFAVGPGIDIVGPLCYDRVGM